MNADKALAYMAFSAVLLMLTAFMFSTMGKEGSKMVAFNKTQEIRVVCYLPDETNRKLQAQASLDGISKQTLTRQILIDWVNSSEEKQAKKNARKQTTKTPESAE